MKKIVILGAGMTGRLAKIMFPEALVLEKNSQNGFYNANVGVHVSIVSIPEFTHIPYERFITIDGQIPSLDLIKCYKKKIARDEGINYGDCRQFEPIQKVYRNLLPQGLDIRFNFKVGGVNLENKKVYSKNPYISYDYLINTIPLIDFISITNLFSHFKEHSSSFFMHRPIYVNLEKCLEEEGIIRENYLTDPDTPIYRENCVNGVKNKESLFKLPNAFKVYPGKIYPNLHTEHILRDLVVYDVHCVGRYARWNSQDHIWDTYKQLQFLRRLIYE